MSSRKESTKRETSNRLEITRDRKAQFLSYIVFNSWDVFFASAKPDIESRK